MRKAKEPPAMTPKFEPGQRVRVSANGVDFLKLPATTEGTVVKCGIVVEVQVDDWHKPRLFSPDFWDAI